MRKQELKSRKKVHASKKSRKKVHPSKKRRTMGSGVYRKFAGYEPEVISIEKVEKTKK